MPSEIRIVCRKDEVFEDEQYRLAKLTYDEEGYLIDVEYDIEAIGPESATHEGILYYIDKIYKASLKAVVFQNEDGTYEI